jgi:CDP-diacylglycerol--serine O-phosphatidyltransferase
VKGPRIGNVVVLMPNGFTMGNLCLGMLAIIFAFAGDYTRAGNFVVIGGVLDALDGRVARATRTGTRFGEELDSLVDIVSFGVAPAMIMYAALLRDEKLSWLWPFLFIAAAAIRLAKFNVEQAGRKKTHFYGLPSPAAGMTLATYYPFSQTTLYTGSWIGTLPWQQSMIGVMVVLAILMMSNVQYPALPTVGFRTLKGILGTLVVAGTLIGVTFFTKEFFFPALIAYVLYGLLKTAVVGLLDMRLGGSARLHDSEPALAVVGAGEDAIAEPTRQPQGRRRRRRRRRGREGGPGSTGGAGGAGGGPGGSPQRGPGQPRSDQ